MFALWNLDRANCRRYTGCIAINKILSTVFKANTLEVEEKFLRTLEFNFMAAESELEFIIIYSDSFTFEAWLKFILENVYDLIRILWRCRPVSSILGHNKRRTIKNTCSPGLISFETLCKLNKLNRLGECRRGWSGFMALWLYLIWCTKRLLGLRHKVPFDLEAVIFGWSM